MLNINVIVKRRDILERLKTNRAKHQEEFAEAVDGYLEAKSKKIHDLFHKFGPESLSDDIDVPANFGLQKPVDNTEKYDELINSFELVSEEEIQLPFHDANNIANDSFQWVGTAKFVNAFYSSVKR